MSVQRVVPHADRDYITYLRGKLIEAEAGLTAMNEKYDQARMRFNRRLALRGITPDTDIVGYVDVKMMDPELKYWYWKVEHFQREVAAYATALTGLESARRMLASDGYRVPTEDGWLLRDDRRHLSPVS
jgi:hypothetical protein